MSYKLRYFQRVILKLNLTYQCKSTKEINDTTHVAKNWLYYSHWAATEEGCAQLTRLHVILKDKCFFES